MSGNTNATKRLEDGNVYFRKNTDASFLARLSQKQEPSVIILTCSDSRVVPEKIFSLSLGDAFVVRVVGNSASEPSVLGSLEYAVEHLHVRVLLILGHTGCGAVRAAMFGEGFDNFSKFLRDIERARDKVPEEHANSPDAVAEINVRLQMSLIEDSSTVIMDAVKKGQLTIVGAMYNMATGAVRFL
ncbi:MAG TPA: carbonic anhydrase [Thermoplasmata archaeon]|jgi:carbonic anhydrase